MLEKAGSTTTTSATPRRLCCRRTRAVTGSDVLSVGFRADQRPDQQQQRPHCREQRHQRADGEGQQRPPAVRAGDFPATPSASPTSMRSTAFAWSPAPRRATRPMSPAFQLKTARAIPPPVSATISRCAGASPPAGNCSGAIPATRSTTETLQEPPRRPARQQRQRRELATGDVTTQAPGTGWATPRNCPGPTVPSPGFSLEVTPPPTGPDRSGVSVVDTNNGSSSGPQGDLTADSGGAPAAARFGRRPPAQPGRARPAGRRATIEPLEAAGAPEAQVAAMRATIVTVDDLSAIYVGRSRPGLVGRQRRRGLPGSSTPRQVTTPELPGAARCSPPPATPGQPRMSTC